MKNNRKKILDTARELFLKNGYNGISIRSIAAKARLTTGAIYFHFKNKKDIYRTICLEAIEVLHERFQNEMKGRKTPPQKLISTFDAYVKFFHENSDYYRILMEYRSAYESDNPEDRDEVACRLKEIMSVAEDAIREGIEKGFYREVDPGLLSVFLAAVAEGMLQYKKIGLLEMYNIKDNDFRKFMARIVGRGVELPEN